MNARQRRKALRREARELERKTGLQHRRVEDWAELAEVPESKTHYLEIDVEGCHGWIRPKGDAEAIGDYLSTHTFYDMTHRYRTKLLRSRGFNLTLANWDAEE